MSNIDDEKMQDEALALDEQSQNESADLSTSKKSAQNGKASKNDKKSARDAAKESARLKKEWEDSIVASKKVKREELRAKVKRAMLIMLVFALIVTSVVYVMLLFIEENNIRITASNRHKEKSITLSMDNEFWTPYLNAEGPDEIWNISYSHDPVYSGEHPDMQSDVYGILEADDFKIGSDNGDQFIRFTFMLRNNGGEDANIDYEMTLDFDDYNLHEAVRVMWGQSFKNPNGETYVEDGTEQGSSFGTSVEVYAALSKNERLAGNSFNTDRTQEDGYIECVAYNNDVYMAQSPNSNYYLLKDYEQSLSPEDRLAAQANGYFATTPFASNEYVFQRSTELAKGDIMYCYVSIWLEGSDFDCVDSVLGGFCKIGLNFYAS